MKIRGTPTDSLADIIQSLQLIHKTGMLTVERQSAGNTSEIGKLAFRDGQIVAADVGKLRGIEAFRKLLTWQTCQFVFESSSSTSIAPVTPIPPIMGQNSPTTERRYLVTERRDRETSLNEYTPTSIVPYRAQHMLYIVPDFQRLGLSRLHRQAFFLIDGKRSSQELARLIGRSPQEVLVLLADMERVSLIGY